MSNLRRRRRMGRRYETLPQNLRISPGTVLDACDATTGWVVNNGSLALNTSEFKSGTGSLKFTTASGSLGAATQTISWTPGGSPRLTILPIYLHDDVSGYNSFTVYLSSVSNWSKYFAYTASGTSVSSLLRGWNLLVIPASSWVNSGGDSWANTMVTLKFAVGAKAATVVSASVDEFRSGILTVPTVMISFDDGGQTAYSEGYSYMRQRGLVGNQYAISDLVGTAGYASVAQLQEMYGAGWDIGNHTKDHTNLTTLDQSGCESELSLCKTFLTDNGMGRAASHVAYPYGVRNATTDAAMDAQGMLSGRVVGGVPFMALPLDNLHSIPVRLVQNTDSLATVEGWVDAAIAGGTICHLLFHIIATPADAQTKWTVADFRALIDYIIVKGMRFLTISDLYNATLGPVTVPVVT